MIHGPGQVRGLSLEGVDPLTPEITAVYEQHFDFVWRNARRLGVPDSAIDDVVQDVFVVVCRRLHEFEGRSSTQTWLFGILSNVVWRRKRAAKRLHAHLLRSVDAEQLNELPAPNAHPEDLAAQREAAALLHELLSSLDEEKLTAFVLVELEQRPALEVAEETGVNLNTIHARIRAARKQLQAGIARHRAREDRMAP